ncbi:MAG: tetratricopeptide repeat protein [Candidatus Dormibacterales bacterium]
MDLLQRARELQAQGRLHEALEAAQAACERHPREPEAWALLAAVSGALGMAAASEDAARRAAELSAQA